MLSVHSVGRSIVVAAALVGIAGCASLRPASDLDKDGIGDMADRCPGQQEDGLDPNPNDGCTTAGGVTPEKAEPDKPAEPDKAEKEVKQ